MAITEIYSQAPGPMAATEPSSNMHPRENEGVFLGGDNPTHLFSDQVIAGGDRTEWTIEIPDNLSYDGLVIFINGFGASKASSRPFRHAAAQAGMATATFKPARKDGKSIVHRSLQPQHLHVENLEAVYSGILNNNDNILNKIAGKKDIDLEKILLVPHSMGGLPATKFADAHHNQVDKIVNLATVGYGTTTLSHMARRVPSGLLPSLRHELLPALMNGDIEMSPRHLLDEMKYFGTDITRPIFEGLSCIKSDVRPKVEKLRKVGVGVLYLGFEHDILVSPDTKVAEYVDLHRVMQNAGHLAPQRKARKVVSEINSMIEEYEAQKPKASSLYR